jgi:hypothetical protein
MSVLVIGGQTATKAEIRLGLEKWREPTIATFLDMCGSPGSTGLQPISQPYQVQSAKVFSMPAMACVTRQQVLNTGNRF